MASATGTSSQALSAVDIGANSATSLHLNFPSSTYGSARSSSRVSVHPACLFSILDHYLRRNDNVPEANAEEKADGEESAAQAGSSSSNARSNRVIGTLLGTQTESEVEIKSCFAVPHHESEEQVQVDMEYHRQMIELYRRVHPEETIVGWYATSSDLNAYSALIQDFYTKECVPHQAVHLTIDTDLAAKATTPESGDSTQKPLGVRAYVSSPLGLSPKAENAVFLPLPVTLLSSPAERPALSLLASQSSSTQSTDAAAATSQLAQLSSSGQVVPDLAALTQSLVQIQSQLRRVLAYVQDVVSGKIQGDEVVGRHLLDTIARIPIGASAAEGKDVSDLWNSCLQDVLMVSYLSNIVRAQAEVAGRLTLLS
ncbi:unnamed protein product [Sympodiomycopsis kandeliae]